MKISKMLLAFCLIVCVGVFMAAPPAMGEIKPMTIKFSTAKPDIDGRGMALLTFKDIIQKKSDGKVKVNAYLSGSLYGERDEAEAIGSGAIDMVSFSPYTLLRFDYAFACGAIPDLFPDWKSWEKFWADPNGGGAVQKASAKMGMHFFGEWYSTAPYYAAPTTKKPIRKISDFKGLKLRTPVGLEASAVGVGASPMSLPTADSVTALQTGVVDGVAYTNYHLVKSTWLGVTKYCTDYGPNWTGTGGIAANKAWWDKLSPEMQSLVATSVKEAVAYVNEVMVKQDEELRAFMKSDKGYGKGFYDMQKEDPAEAKKWKQLVIAAFVNQYKSHWSNSFIDALEKYSGSKIR